MRRSTPKQAQVGDDIPKQEQAFSYPPPHWPGRTYVDVDPKQEQPSTYPPLQRLQILCLFMNTGRTYTFRNVRLIMDNESVIVFSYTAMSDGLSKTATFYKDHVAGVSKTQ